MYTITEDPHSKETLINKDDKLVSKMFDQIAHSYDFLNHFLSLNIDQVWRKKLIDLLLISNEDKLLDLCTGTGDLAFQVLKKHPLRQNIEAMDFSKNMLQIAQTKSFAYGLEKKINFIRGNALNMPFNNATFDKVTVGFGVRNFSDLEKGVGEIFRVLKPRGVLGILEFFPHSSQPVFRYFFHYYFHYILPLIGNFFSKSSMDAYRYLPNSVRHFSSASHMQQILVQQGFKKIQHKKLFFGLVHILLAHKE